MYRMECTIISVNVTSMDKGAEGYGQQVMGQFMMHILNVNKIISPIIIIVSTLHVANFDPSPAMRKLHATKRFVRR